MSNQTSADRKTSTPDETAQFSSPQKVFNICENMQLAEDVRARDRAKINVLFNGSNPYSREEEERYQIQINVNWGYGKSIIRDAISQLNSAFRHNGVLFNCTPTEGPIEKRDVWANYFTKNIHHPIQKGTSGRQHFFLMGSRNACISLHGIGAILWPNDFKWMGRYVPLEDLLIPTDTYCDFSNMRYFGVNLYLSPGEFAAMALGEKKVDGWNEKQVKAILDSQKENIKGEGPSPFWRDQPEAVAEIFKQNRGFYYSDAVPTIKLRAFYWQDVDKPGTWYRHIILRENVAGANPDEFVYDGTGKVFSTDINRILNVQYGDGNFVAPLKYHSVRGIGIDLYAPVEALNRIQCQTVQHTLEQLQMLFKIQDPADKARLRQFVLEQFGYIPEGLTIVPRDQRHQVDAGIVELSMSLIRQNMQESSSGFVPNVDDGTDKEMTAKEATIRLNKANVMVSGMLQSLDLQQNFYWEEVVRRFCDPKSDDQEVKDFQKKCIENGIPEELVKDATKWRVATNRVLGGGDKTLAQGQAMFLFQNRNAYPPESQQKILRIVTRTILDDPAKADDLAPESPTKATAGVLAAEDVFATLMTGNNVQLRSGIDEQGYITTLLKFMAGVIDRIEKTDNMGTVSELLGLHSVGQNITDHIKILEADPAQKQEVKAFSDALAKLSNDLKGFGQRLSQKMKAGAGKSLSESINIAFKDLNDDTKNAVLVSIGLPPSQISGSPQTAKAVLGLATKQAAAEQRQRHSEIEFALEQAKENLRAVADLSREEMAHRQSLANAAVQKAFDLWNQAMQPPQEQTKPAEETT